MIIKSLFVVIPLTLPAFYVQASATFIHPATTNLLAFCQYSDTSCATSIHHTGVDYGHLGDKTVIASNVGTIVKIEKMHPKDHGMGNNVTIKHQLEDGSVVYSSYSHLYSIEPSLKKGSVIQQSDKIGMMGGSGHGKRKNWATHLHFEIKKDFLPQQSIQYWEYTPQHPDNYGYLDPLDFIGKRRATLDGNNEETSAFDGAGSLVNAKQECWGCNKDEVKMHAHTDKQSTVVFQWLHDPYQCEFINLYATESIEVMIRAKDWSSNETQLAFKTILSKNPISLSKVADWTTLSITSLEPLSTETLITADCRKPSEPFSQGSKEIVEADSVGISNNTFWAGTGSIISQANRSGYGADRDKAITLKNTNSLTSFQWYASDTCKTLKISGDASAPRLLANVSIKEWNQKKFTQTCSSLPCTISQPEGFLIITVSSEASEFKGVTIEASCQN